MTPDAQQAKLDLIADLCIDQLRGWAWGMSLPTSRPYFDGEKFALDQRALELGATMREICAGKGK